MLKLQQQLNSISLFRRAKEVEKRKEKLSTSQADKAVPYLLVADFTDASGLVSFPKVSSEEADQTAPHLFLVADFHAVRLYLNCFCSSQGETVELLDTSKADKWMVRKTADHSQVGN